MIKRGDLFNQYGHLSRWLFCVVENGSRILDALDAFPLIHRILYLSCFNSLFLYTSYMGSCAQYVQKWGEVVTLQPVARLLIV